MSRAGLLIATAAGIILTALMCIGIYMYRVPAEAVHEQALVPWGATVVGYIFFALLSGGIADSAIMHAYLEKSETARRLLRRSLYGALAVLVPGIVLVFADILHPENAAWFYLGFNPASRIAWNAVLYLLYGGFLVAFLVTLIRLGEDQLDQPLMKLLALLVVATSMNLEINLGMAYGVNIGVPAWYGAYAGILFLVVAFLMGSAWEALMAYMRGLRGEELEHHVRSYAWEHLFAAITLGLVVFWNLLARYGWGLAQPYTVLVTVGYLAPYFWIAILLAIILPILVTSLYLWKRVGTTTLYTIMMLAVAGSALYLLVPFNLAGQFSRLEETMMYRLLGIHTLGAVEASEITMSYLASPELLAFIGGFGLWLLLEFAVGRLIALGYGEKPRRLLVLRV